MTGRFSVAFVVVALALAGCSKHSKDPTATETVNLGVVELSSGTPIRQDLGGGKVCVLTAQSLGGAGIELLAVIEKSGREIASTRALPIQPDQPMELSLGGVRLSLTPHLK